MRDPVVLSSELLKKVGCAKFYRAVLNRLKRTGSVRNFTVPGFELIEKIGIRRRAVPARRRPTECIFMKKDGERAVLFSFLRCMPYFFLYIFGRNMLQFSP